MDVSFEFEPVKTLSGVALADITPTSALSIFGDPDEIEKAEAGNFGEPSFTYLFNDAQLTLFFDVERLLCFATTNPSFKLFGENVFKLLEDAGVTIFFDNQKISEIFIDV